MAKKEKSNRAETISNRFPMSKLVYKMIFDQFAAFSVFDSFSSGKQTLGSGQICRSHRGSLLFIYVEGQFRCRSFKFESLATLVK